MLVSGSTFWRSFLRRCNDSRRSRSDACCQLHSIVPPLLVYHIPGDPLDDECLAYASHKQPSLHGSKSIGAFRGDIKASGAQQTNIELMPRLPGEGNRLHTYPWERCDARENGVIESSVLRHHPLQTQQTAYSGGPSAAANEAIKVGNILQSQGLELSRGRTISKKRRGKNGATLVPVRGISRVVANFS